MAGRKRSIRVKIFAILLVPVTALVVIWVVATSIIVQSGLELFRVGTVYDSVVVPTRAALAELQHERLLTASYLGSAISFRSELDTQRQKTDAAVQTLDRVSRSVQNEAPPAMWERLQKLIRQLGELDVLRGQVDNHKLSRLAAIEAYSDIAEIGYQTYERLAISTNVDLLEQARAISLIDRGREIMSQESALIAGALSATRMSQEERDNFAAMTSKRRMLYQLGISQLDTELRDLHERLSTSPEYGRFTTMEDEVVDRVKPNTPLPAEAALWRTTAETMAVTFDQLDGEISKRMAARAAPLAQSALLRIGIAGIVGLLVVATAVFISFRFARRLTFELVGLLQAALELANERLPRIVERLRRGEDVDVTAETPALLTGGDTAEVENLGEAFTSVQHTAIEAAVGQAELRKGVNKVFLNLARRSQSLLHRQLAMLDGLEQQVTDPDLLEKLFGVDHLTTRMRRHSEGLIILSGAAPGRGWRNPVSLFDVVRGSVEEVEDYLRVSVSVPHGPALIGGAVTDVIHLVAELVENATIFSPPHTQVFVRGEPVARGFVLEVEDRGLGINREELTHLNHRLANPPEFDLADSDRLGLFVVGRLAERHGIRVSLQPSPYGGTTAIVLIPQEIVVEATESEYSVEQLVAPQPAPAPALALALTPPVGDEDSLPKRVRQANLAPQLREEPRDVLSSFQAGWKRGKEEA